MERNSLEAEWENIRILRRILATRKEEWPDWVRKVYKDETGVATEMERCRSLLEMAMKLEDNRLNRMAAVMQQQQSGLGPTSGFASPRMKSSAEEFDSFINSKNFDIGK